MFISDSRRFDVVVIGGGPGGSLTAYRLSKAGMRVLVVEADRFPREKPCGGGVQERASSRIPMAWHSAVQEELHEVFFSFGLRGGFSRRHSSTLVSSVLRAEFDQLLLEQAEKSGATVWQGCKANQIIVEGASTSGVTVLTTNGAARAQFAVGADGANSLVARQLNSRGCYYWQVALYCEIPEGYLLPESFQPSRMRIDWGTLPSGYGWIFPKKGSINVGVGCPLLIGRALRPYLKRFLEAERILKPNALGGLQFQGHQLPTLTARTRLSSSNLLLVGDAAGLVEPLTGEGISNACHSAEIASKFICEKLSSPSKEGDSYDNRIRREIGDEIELARQLLSVAVAFPRSLFRALQDNDIVWSVLCQILRGEDSFLALRRAIMGRFGSLWRPLCRFSEWFEQRRLHLYHADGAHYDLGGTQKRPHETRT